MKPVPQGGNGGNLMALLGNAEKVLFSANEKFVIDGRGSSIDRLANRVGGDDFKLGGVFDHCGGSATIR